jgi:predicted nucleic acid-binding protein
LIVVDTSVWVDYFRRGSRDVRSALSSLLDQDQVVLVAPVRVELFSGASGQDLPRLKRVLSALPLWLPTDATWATMERWAQDGGGRGQRFGLGDLLVGAIAAERGSPVWSLDGDFHRMQRLGFVQLHEP